MLTLRLDEDLEHKIDVASERLGITKSELIRRSVQTFINGISKPSPWEVGCELFGKFDSGVGTLSSNRKEIVRQALARKFK